MCVRLSQKFEKGADQPDVHAYSEPLAREALTLATVDIQYNIPYSSEFSSKTLNIFEKKGRPAESISYLFKV